MKALHLRERCFLATFFNVTSISGLSNYLDGVNAVFAKGDLNGNDWRVIAHLGWILLSQSFDRNGESLPPGMKIFQYVQILYQLVMRPFMYVSDLEILNSVCNHIKQYVYSNEDFQNVRKKPKIHLLEHFVEDIRRFGPLANINSLVIYISIFRQLLYRYL